MARVRVVFTYRPADEAQRCTVVAGSRRRPEAGVHAVHARAAVPSARWWARLARGAGGGAR